MTRAGSGGAVTHFGVRVQRGSVYGLRIDRATYARINKRSSTPIPRELLSEAAWARRGRDFDDEDQLVRSDEWCAWHQARALENFDLNMAYFAQLDRSEFAAAVDAVMAMRKTRWLTEVTDLNRWESRGGLYVMVLDDYCQVYVGITQGSVGVKARIRQHWSSSKQFDRLLFGEVEDSILSIDSFRALDTTRIFAVGTTDPWSLEDAVVGAFPSKFVLNRIAGGDSRILGVQAALGVDVVRRHRLVDDGRAGEPIAVE